MPKPYLLPGPTQGIGLEFAKQYVAHGYEVIATHRQPKTPVSLATKKDTYPDRIIFERINVRDLDMVEFVAAKYRDKPIDILISNAAIVADLTDPTPQIFGSLEFPLLSVFMETNVRGPLRVFEAFYENMKSSQMKRIVMISSLAGSLAVPPRRLPGPGLLQDQ